MTEPTSVSRRRLQIIDDQKTFNQDTGSFLGTDCSIRDTDYHLVAVLGPQSSGKSTEYYPSFLLMSQGTLLNALFGTNFDVMTDDKRAQTTHGIWLSKSTKGSVLVLDVEGTDGREHAEDQDFERKSALFSLAIAEVLIVNMWEHSVGLYHGANMSLLKTVLDVHLQLFKDNQSAAKTTLFFVIRDFIGQTPAESLTKTLLTDISSIWSSLNKPENYADKAVTDVFRVEFAFLPHKILKPSEFIESCNELSKRFEPEGESIFGSETSAKIVPADGLSVYMDSIWTKISSNKDLDLPNQQELLAQYRCDELSQQFFSELVQEWSSKRSTIKTSTEFKGLASKLKSSALENFSSIAFRYTKAIFERKLFELSDQIDNYLLPFSMNFIQESRAKLLSGLEQGSKTYGKLDNSAFLKLSSSAATNLKAEFSQAVDELSSISDKWDFEELQSSFNESVDSKILDFKKARLQKCEKELFDRFHGMVEEHINSNKFVRDQTLWSDLPSFIHDQVEKFSTDIENITTELNLEKSAVPSDTFKESIVNLLQKCFNEKAIRQIVRHRFELSFRYEGDRPRVWSSETMVDVAYDASKESANTLLDAIRLISFTDGQFKDTEIVFLDSNKTSELKRQLNSEFELLYLDTKRAIISQATQIPPWIYVLLLVLGWNEFMTILKSPLYLTMCIILGTLYFVTQALGMQQVLINKARGQFSQILEQLKGFAPATNVELNAQKDN